YLLVKTLAVASRTASEVKFSLAISSSCECCRSVSWRMASKTSGSTSARGRDMRFSIGETVIVASTRDRSLVPNYKRKPMDEKLDIREKGGVRNGVQQVSDRRLFMQLLAFGDAENTQTLTRALEAARIPGVLYADANDPHGVGLLTWSEDPDFFVSKLRDFLRKPEFASLTPKLEYSMLGRTYSLGHEPDLDDWLFEKPKRNATDKT